MLQPVAAAKIQAANCARRKLKDVGGAAGCEHAAAPGPQFVHTAHHHSHPVEIYQVDRVAHQTGMDAGAPRNKQAMISIQDARL